MHRTTSFFILNVMSIALAMNPLTACFSYVRKC